MKDYKQVIDGGFLDAAEGGRLKVRNPVDNEVIGSVPEGTARDAAMALEAAERAFPAWESLAPQTRAELMRQSAALVRERRREIAATLTMEQGKPLNDALKELQDAAGAIDFFAGEALRVRGEIIPTGAPGAFSLVFRQPVGVCVAIAPWNYPVSLLSWKIGPALAAGCTVVAKPATETPLSSIEFIQCFLDAGIPRGVVNIVTGRGGGIGTELIRHPVTRKVAITGSTEVGKIVAGLAGQHLKKVSLELGGHSPFVIFPDADLNTAVREAVRRSFRNMGQICNSVNRIFVHESIREIFLEQFLSETKALTMGDGLKNPDVDLGPMVNEEGIRRTTGHIEDAVARGARLLWGGKKPQGAQYDKGFFLEPAILTNVPADALIMQEETFGPAVAVATFKTPEEAAQFANATRYGLVAYVFTREIGVINLLGQRLKFGTICINNTAAASVQAPYGGWKESGLGIELSHHAVNEYLHFKHVRIQT